MTNEVAIEILEMLKIRPRRGSSMIIAQTAVNVALQTGINALYEKKDRIEKADNDLSSELEQNSKKLEKGTALNDCETCIHNKGVLECDMYGCKYEPTTKNDLALINTWGLDKEIRCTMCTNSMKSDRGCDGSCVVNNAMYKKVMDVIENHIQPTTRNDIRDNEIKDELKQVKNELEPTTKNDLGVDAVSRKKLLKIYEDRFYELQKLKHLKDNKGAEDRQMGVNYCINILKELPSVTPIRPKGHWIHVMEGNALRVECSECHNREVNRSNFCPNCGAKMDEVEE